jgi:hypothetical protein
MELPSIPRSVPVEAAGRETPPDIHMAASTGMRPGHPTRVRCARLGRKGGGMDRDTLQDDLDLILERSRDDELPGEWVWEPPLGTGTSVAISAAELRESEETDTEASSDAAGPSLDGPDDEADDEAGGDADDDETGRLSAPSGRRGRSRAAPSEALVRRRGRTERAPGRGPPLARSHRHPRTRTRRPTSRRTTDPAGSRRRGRTPDEGS